MAKKNKVAYITAKSPLASIETYLISEMLSLKNLDIDMLIIPRDRSHKIFHKKAHPLLKNILNIPWFNLQIAKELIKYISENTISFFKVINDIAFNAKNLKIALKNLIILPKSLYLAQILECKIFSHIHAHRGSTPSTMAYIISKITGISWSFTVHRFDIYENNILKKKIESASFVRCISNKGKNDLLKIVGDNLSFKVKMIPMGVEVPFLSNDVVRNNIKNQNNLKKVFTLIVPANLLPVKGHLYFVEACNILVKRGFLNFKCKFYGNGPLKKELKKIINRKGLAEYINLCGAIPHEQLIRMYKDREVDILILPSIITKNGEFEGIPVSLTEAMAYMIPVISTDTGGIPELIGDGSGIMVRDKSPEAIANAIEKLIKDISYYNFVSRKGREKIEKDFNISVVSKELLYLFQGNSL